MPRVLWTPVAESDLDDILFYIAYVGRRPDTGERICFDIRDLRLNDRPRRRFLATAIQGRQTAGNI